MAQTPSTMLDLGTKAPTFELSNAVDGRRVGLSDFEGSPALLVAFICNHCPYVIHIRPALVKLIAEYQPKGLAAVAINANSLQTHPQDGPQAMRELALAEGWTFPFLFDATQEVAKAYQAACTPDLFLFDRSRALVYRGQFDDARPGKDVPVTGRDLRAAVEATLAGRAVSAMQRPSIGCNIKWSPGNAPAYFG
jgi:peroxiredoxin